MPRWRKPQEARDSLRQPDEPEANWVLLSAVVEAIVLEPSGVYGLNMTVGTSATKLPIGRVAFGWSDAD